MDKKLNWRKAARFKCPHCRRISSRLSADEQEYMLALAMVYRLGKRMQPGRVKAVSLYAAVKAVQHEGLMETQNSQSSLYKRFHRVFAPMQPVAVEEFGKRYTVTLYEEEKYSFSKGESEPRYRFSIECLQMEEPLPPELQ